MPVNMLAEFDHFFLFVSIQGLGGVLNVFAFRSKSLLRGIRYAVKWLSG
jgi:hypothetical protein